MMSDDLRSAFRYQNEYCEAFCDFDWDRYHGTDNEFIQIQKKIAYALFGQPEKLRNEDVSNVLAGYSPSQIKMVTPLYDKIIQLKKYSLDGETIFMAILFICCVPLDENLPLVMHSFIESEKITISPVFKIRKCIKKTDSDTGCCIYIDDQGRVYDDWKSYIENNKLPKGVMIVPRNGKYSYDTSTNNRNCVLLEVHETPASSTLTVMMNALNTGSTVASFGASGVFLTTIFAPVAAPILTGAVIVGLAASICTATTSVMSLIDRSKHEQTIDLSDAEARNCWINIAATSFGITSGAASKYIATSVSRGVTISQVMRGVCNTALVGSIGTSFAGISYGFFTMISNYSENGQSPSKIEILQFSASLFFFTHSLVNFKTANTVIEETQASTLYNQKDTLRSNRHRKMFEKMAAETQRRHGNVETGRAEVIRALNNIDDKDTFFANALRMNKELNKNQIKISFHEDGNALLNTNTMINPEQHMSLPSVKRSEHYATIGPSELSAKNCPTKLKCVPPTMSAVNLEIGASAIRLLNFGFKCTNELDMNSKTSEIVYNIYKMMTDEFPEVDKCNNIIKKMVTEKICTLLADLIGGLEPHYKEKFEYLKFSTKGDWQEQICVFIIKQLKIQVERKSQEIQVFLTKYFHHHYHLLKDKLNLWLDGKIITTTSPTQCSACLGIRYSI